MRSNLKRVEDDMGVECLVIYMAAHGVDVWAVGGTYEWERGGGDGYRAGPLAGVGRVRWAPGRPQSGPTAKHPGAI